jgi:HSP20 family molecular chaperone IbpA
MKFHLIPVAAAAIVPALTLTADGYMYNSVGPNCRPPNRDSFASSARSERFRQRQVRVNKAFEELQREMYNEAQRNNNKKKNGQFDWAVIGPGGDFQQIDKEAVKKWVDKAFELASEFNQDFSSSPRERENNDEFLKISREFVDPMYNKVDSEEGVDKDKAPNATAPSASSDGDELNPIGTIKVDDQPITSDTPTKEPDVETPYSENRSDGSMFQVAVDLPGVDRADVDISLEGDSLVIQAKKASKR